MDDAALHDHEDLDSFRRVQELFASRFGPLLIPLEVKTTGEWARPEIIPTPQMLGVQPQTQITRNPSSHRRLDANRFLAPAPSGRSRRVDRAKAVFKVQD
jgi:hypothetical protein